MNKPKLNFIINALMFLCLMAMAGLGFLMKYILPPGREVMARYDRNLYLTWLVCLAGVFASLARGRMQRQ